MKKLPWIALCGLLAVSCGSRSHSSHNDDDEEVGSRKKVSEKVERSSTASSDTLWKADIRDYFSRGKYDLAFNDSNYIQYAAAEKLGIKPIFRLADAYYSSRPLVKLESGENFQLEKLTHSLPYLVPEAADLLNEIGASFNSKLKEKYNSDGYRIKVTSLLRTPYSQRKLKRVNGNAVDSSTHLMGTTFDIAYNSFHVTDSTNSVNGVALKNLLAEVLLEKRLEEKCYVKYEVHSPCFHITVRTDEGSK